MAQKKHKKTNKTKVNSGQTKKSSRTFFYTVVGIIIACLVLLVVLNKVNKSNNESATSKATFNYSAQPSIGSKDAPVKIMEFGDYKCPVCKSFNQNTMPQVEKELIDTGKAQLYFMNFPFINVDSTRSAKFAEIVFAELGNDTFWKFHKLLYDVQNPKDEKKDVFTEDYLLKVLAEVTTDKNVQKVKSAFDGGDGQDALDADMNTVKKYGINSTPTLYINGKKYTGNYTDFVDAVKSAAKSSK